MGLDLWFRADVARILQATHEAMCSTAAVMGDAIAEGNRGDDAGGRERAAGYRQGFGAALRVVATAFGLTEHGGVPDRWRVMGPAEVAPGSAAAGQGNDFNSCLEAPPPDLAPHGIGPVTVRSETTVVSCLEAPPPDLPPHSAIARRSAVGDRFN